jgi:hypothetical protein
MCLCCGALSWCLQKVRAPLHDYVRHLLLDRLNSDSIEDVLRIIRKLPWSADPNVEGASRRTSQPPPLAAVATFVAV